MRFSYGRVAFFEDFGRWKIRCYFGAVLGRSWNVNNEQKRRRVALFLSFGVCNIRRRFGAVLGGSWGGFWELF